MPVVAEEARPTEEDEPAPKRPRACGEEAAAPPGPELGALRRLLELGALRRRLDAAQGLSLLIFLVVILIYMSIILMILPLYNAQFTELHEIRALERRRAERRRGGARGRPGGVLRGARGGRGIVIT